MLHNKKVALVGLTALIGISQIAPANAADMKSGLTACPITATYSVTARTTGWMPTDESTGMIQGPLSVPFAGTRTYVTPTIYNGSVSISMSGVVAAANSSYGSGTYANPSSVTANWDWSGTLPSAYSQFMVLHRGDKITFTEVQDNANCTSTTSTGLVAYLPLNASAQSNFCRIVDVSPAKTNWSSTCTD